MLARSVVRKGALTCRFSSSHTSGAVAKDLGDFDYVIVGGGSAGCVLANRLSADPSNRVALLEAGGDDRYHWVHIPVGYVYTMRYPQHRTNWGFQTCAQPGLNGREIYYPRGKLLGGSGSINGMIAMRGQAEDYDGWAAALGDEGWSWSGMRPHFERLMNYTAGDPTLPDGTALGTGGPLEVTKQALHWPVLDQWADACELAGLPRRTHFIDSQHEGVGYFEVTQHHPGKNGIGGIRLSPYRAFLAPVENRPNLTVFTNSHAKELTLHKGDDGKVCCSGLDVWLRRPRDTLSEYARAVAVDAGIVKGRNDDTVEKQSDVLATIRASREVILAAGAVSSPHLMQCSGIGGDKLLRSRDVQTCVDLPGVGANLQDHLQIRAVFQLADDVDTLNTRMNSWSGMVKAAAQYATRQEGAMAMAPSQLGAFARSSDAVSTPDLQWHVQPLSLDSWEEPLHPWPGLTASVCHLRPTSRGEVELLTSDSRDAPHINPNYLNTEQDQAVAIKAMRITRGIAEKLDPVLDASEYVPGKDLETDEELLVAAGNIATSIFHPAGTTRMGPDGDGSAVLNQRLQVRDGTHSGVIRGLRVADCGVMPTITSGNTNLPTYAIAEKAAHMILEDRGESLANPATRAS